MSPSETFVVQQDGTGLWVMDCYADSCWAYVESPYAEFETKAAAERAATRHRKWHAARAAVADPLPCPTCGADGRHRRDLKRSLAAAEGADHGLV